MFYIRLPGNGGIFAERDSQPYTSLHKPDVSKDDGEWLIFWGRLRVILTPPGWKRASTSRTA